MKLLDFITFEPFNLLKESMGIPRDKLGTIRKIVIRKPVFDDDYKLKNGGLEVDIKDIIFLTDGTLGLKNTKDKNIRRILLYIRDVQYYNEPRFHISACKTLHQMKSAGRFEQKYIGATNEDGFFEIHNINTGKKEKKKLMVCQNCLDLLNFNGFKYVDKNFSWDRSSAMEQQRKNKSIVEHFSISEFFEKYPNPIQYYEPIYNDITAPTNTYPANFNDISRSYRNKVGWKCERCGLMLKELSLQRYLHVHHKDGGKHNNVDSNLEALCIRCHAEEPMHGHMKKTKTFVEFLADVSSRHRYPPEG